MLVSDVISRVRNIAGDTDALQFTDANIMQWINDALKECASANQLLQKTATQTVTQAVSEYALPDDILKIHSVKYDGQKIRMTTLQQADEEFTLDDSQGTSSVGWVWTGSLNLYPVPDNSTKELKVMYTRIPVEAVNPGDELDLPVMYHRRIVDYCLAMVAEQDDDANRYQIKMQEFLTGVQTLKDEPEWEQDYYPSIGVSSRDMGDGYFDESWN